MLIPNMKAILIGSMVLGLPLLISSCTPSVVLNPHFVPHYICEADPGLTAASWIYRGKAATVVFKSKKDGSVLCRASSHAGFCLFTDTYGNIRSLTEDDVPVNIEAIHNKKTIFSTSMSPVVLSKPRNTEDFRHDGVIESSTTTTHEVYVPEYARCFEAPDGTPSNTNLECTTPEPEPGSLVPPEPECVCPNEGRVIGMKKELVDIVTTFPTALKWNLGSLFSPYAVTKSMEYVQGEGNTLNFKGPGINGFPSLSPGNVTAGNNQYPGGLWIGEIPEGTEVTTMSDSSEPSFEYKIRLKVSCQ